MNSDMRTILTDAIERVRKETGVAIRRLDVEWLDSVGGTGHVIALTADIVVGPVIDDE